MNKPICARCGREVDRFIEEHNTFTEVVRYTAYCHGETESVSFNEAELNGAVRLGHAFTAQRLLGARLQ